MEVCYQLNKKQIEQLHALYQKESWSRGRTQEETQRGVEHSSLCVALIDSKGNLAAFTRVLTDTVFKALIFDVIVHEKYRGDGFGNTLITAIKNHPLLTQVKHFELYCLPELEAFYERHGFTTDVSNMRLMRYINKSSETP